MPKPIKVKVVQPVGLRLTMHFKTPEDLAALHALEVAFPDLKTNDAIKEAIRRQTAAMTTWRPAPFTTATTTTGNIPYVRWLWAS